MWCFHSSWMPWIRLSFDMVFNFTIDDYIKGEKGWIMIPTRNTLWRSKIYLHFPPTISPLFIFIPFLFSSFSLVGLSWEDDHRTNSQGLNTTVLVYSKRMKTKTIGYPFYLLTRWSRRYGIEIGHEGAGSKTCYGEFMYVCMYVRICAMRTSPFWATKAFSKEFWT